MDSCESRNTCVMDAVGVAPTANISGDVRPDRPLSDLVYFSKTSVLIVSISFIVLMALTILWLCFYYVQRARQQHVNELLKRRLYMVMRKALRRIPTMPITPSMTKEMQSQCAICLENFKLNDIIRTLPCKHIYHKVCIEPWLLEHCTCPICKHDILKHFGYWEELYYGAPMPEMSRVNEYADDYIINLELGNHGIYNAVDTPRDDASPEVNLESSVSQVVFSNHSVNSDSCGDSGLSNELRSHQRPHTARTLLQRPIKNLVQVKPRPATGIRKASLPTPIEISTSTVTPLSLYTSDTRTTSATPSTSR